MLTEVWVVTIDDYPVAVFAERGEATTFCTEEKKETGFYYHMRCVDFGSPDWMQVYRCHGCGEWRTWCDGGTDSELCDECAYWKSLPWWQRIWKRKGRHSCGSCK